MASAVTNVFGSNSGAMEMTVTGNYVKDLEICSQEKEAVVLTSPPREALAANQLFNSFQLVFIKGLSEMTTSLTLRLVTTCSVGVSWIKPAE